MRYDHETRKKQNLVRLVLCVFIGLVGTLAMGLCFSVQADVSCGSEIVLGGGTVILPNDLTCSGGTGLTVTGPGTLDLNGHTVRSNGTGTGIVVQVVQGTGAEILNGTVKGWGTAVDVKAQGKHRIANLKIENNAVGIRVRSDSSENNVSNNCIKYNSDRGIRLQGDTNTVIKNYIQNSNKGIRVDKDSDNNMIVSNIMVGNNAENCDIKGNNNLLVGNLAKDGLEECFLIGDLEDATIAPNGNRLVNNTAYRCKKGGFVASASTLDNYFVQNIALGNTPDLLDKNGNCDDNTWVMNFAYSANPQCTKAIIWDIAHTICY